MSIYDQAQAPATVYQLFPTPVYIDNIGREFNQHELGVIDNIKTDTRPNQGNQISQTSEALGQMPQLKLAVEQALADYAARVIRPLNPLEIYVTQSWINYTHDGEYHHPHRHPNSFLSGVVYLTAEEGDSITFHTPHPPHFDFAPTTINIFNAIDWSFPIKTGDLVIFPSQLEHDVSKRSRQGVRVSLAFNTWFRGELGLASRRTHLQV